MTNERARAIRARAAAARHMLPAWCALAIPVALQANHDTPHATPRSLGERGALHGDTTRARGGAGTDTADLPALIAAALASNPALRAARERVAARRARIGPAGLRPDPVLMAGLVNFPVSQPGFRDAMTMKMIGIGQTLPYRGKLGLRRDVAAREADASSAAALAAGRQLIREVRGAYYDLAFLDAALAIVRRNQQVMADVAELVRVRYTVATAEQPDVLRARLESVRIAGTAVQLTERRRAVLARLNAMLNRPSDAAVAAPHIPARIAHAAVADSASRVRFTSAALGARAADSPLPPLETLQSIALRENPALREQDAVRAAQAARVALAQREHLPDFDISLQYGQRVGLPDMVSATVAVPLPMQRARRQALQVSEARADMAARDAELSAAQNDLRADVARLVADAERQRAQLALYVTAILPQSRASLTSATANYQVGRVEFVTLLETQSILFSYETEYFRTLSDFASTLAELEEIVGVEVLP